MSTHDDDIISFYINELNKITEFAKTYLQIYGIEYSNQLSAYQLVMLLQKTMLDELTERAILVEE